MKRILAFLLMLAMLFGSVCALASCGDGVALGDKTTTEANKSSGNVTIKDNDDNNKTPSKDNEEDTEYTITYIDEFYSYHFAKKCESVGYLGFYGAYARFKASNGCYGYIDSEGNVVIEPIYEEAQVDFDEDVARVKKDGMYMFIDREGNVIFTADFNYKSLSKFENGFFCVQTMEETIGGNVYTMTYYKVLYFKDNAKNAKFETVDIQGAILSGISMEKLNVCIEEAFEIENAVGAGTMSYFNEDGYALVNVPQTTGSSLYDGVLINTNGDICNFEGISEGESISDWYRNLAFISDYTKDSSGRYVYLDFDNQVATRIGIFYDEDDYLMNDYINDYYFVSNGSSWNGVDYGDSIILRGLYISNNSLHTKNIINLSDIEEFAGASIMGASGSSLDEGLRLCFNVYLKSKNGVFFSAVINDDGEILVSPTKEYQLGYQDTSVIPYRYVCYAFSGNGLCKAKDTETGLFGYIDLEGNWAMDPQYTSATDFCDIDGVAVVNNGKTIIDSKGNIVLTLETAK